MHRFTKLVATNNNSVKKIYHFADIHIRLDTRRHEEYKEVFSRLYNQSAQQTNKATLLQLF